MFGFISRVLATVGLCQQRKLSHQSRVVFVDINLVLNALS